MVFWSFIEFNLKKKLNAQSISINLNGMAGDFCRVKPGVYHQFEGVKSGIAFELYWAEFNHGDIIRQTFGKEI